MFFLLSDIYLSRALFLAKVSTVEFKPIGRQDRKRTVVTVPMADSENSPARATLAQWNNA
jgi:hypothetical protein